MTDALPPDNDNHDASPDRSENDIAAQAFITAFDEYEKTNPQWRVKIVLGLIYQWIEILKQRIDDSSIDNVTWDSPFTEAHYDIPEFESDVTVALDLSAKIQVSQHSRDLADNLNLDSRVGFWVEAPDLRFLCSITDNIRIIVHADESCTIRTPPGYKGPKADEQKPENTQALLRPRTVGESNTHPIEYQIREGVSIPKLVMSEFRHLLDANEGLVFSGVVGGEFIRAGIVLQIHPRVLDLKTGTAYFQLGLGLVFLPDKNKSDSVIVTPENWSEQKRSEFWVAILRWFDPCQVTDSADATPNTVEFNLIGTTTKPIDNEFNQLICKLSEIKTCNYQVDRKQDLDETEQLKSNNSQDNSAKQNQFRRDGDGWHICYQGQRGHYKSLDGFFYIHQLIRHRQDNGKNCKPLDAIDMVRSLKQPDTTAARTRSAITADPVDKKDRVEPQTETGGSMDLVLDQEGKDLINKKIKECGDNIADIEIEISETSSEPEQERLIRDELNPEIAKLNQLKGHLDQATGLGGRPRLLSISNPSKARQTVSQRMKTAHDRLNSRDNPMVKLVTHLKASIPDAIGNAYIYRPESAPDWVLE